MAASAPFRPKKMAIFIQSYKSNALNKIYFELAPTFQPYEMGAPTYPESPLKSHRDKVPH
jgi:hypothetical protein